MIRLACLLSLLVPALGTALDALPADPSLISAEQYDTLCRYERFLADRPTWERKYKTESRAKKAFARAERAKVAQLDALVTAAATIGKCSDFQAVWARNLSAALADLGSVGDVVKLFDEVKFAKRINWSEVNASSSQHVVVWVSWKFASNRFIEEEAVLVGSVVHRVIPATGTLSIWAHKGKKKRMVFEAKAYGTSLGRFQTADIGSYAKKRYWRSFEGIRFHPVTRRKLQDGERSLTAKKAEPTADASAN
jgi:hypothetical protein